MYHLFYARKLTKKEWLLVNCSNEPWTANNCTPNYLSSELGSTRLFSLFSPNDWELFTTVPQRHSIPQQIAGEIFIKVCFLLWSNRLVICFLFLSYSILPFSLLTSPLLSSGSWERRVCDCMLQFPQIAFPNRFHNKASARLGLRACYRLLTHDTATSDKTGMASV